MAGLESALSSVGLPVHQRFGRVDGEFTALLPDEPIPEGWKLHVETLQRGYANVTLGPGSHFRFDHFGIYTTPSEFHDVLDRAEAAGWGVSDRERRRTFVITPWRFRIEIHPTGNEVEAGLGSWSDAHIEQLVLVVPDATVVRSELERTIGSVPGLVIESGDVERSAVPTFTLGGAQFPDGRVVDVQELAGREGSPNEK